MGGGGPIDPALALDGTRSCVTYRGGIGDCLYCGRVASFGC